MLKKAALLAGVLLLSSLAAVAQDGRFVVSVNAAGLLNRQSHNSSMTLTSTDSVGFLGSLQWKFAPKSSFELSYGRSHNSEVYEQLPLVYRITADVTELSLAYKYTTQFRGFHPFLLAGGGALVFAPSGTFVNDISTTYPALRQAQPAILYGAGVDYPLLGSFALRVQYRGFIYQPPSFKQNQFVMGGHTHTAEPSIGISFTF
jgi:outer membrane immunogenic protein